MDLKFVNEQGHSEVVSIPSDKSAYVYAACLGLFFGIIFGLVAYNFA